MTILNIFFQLFFLFLNTLYKVNHILFKLIVDYIKNY